MKQWLLRFFTKAELVNYMIRETEFDIVVDPKSDTIWQEAFMKVPDLRIWFKKRKNIILKSLYADERSDIRRGQFLELSLLEKYDTPNKVIPKVETNNNIEEELTRDVFLNKWNKEDE